MSSQSCSEARVWFRHLKLIRTAGLMPDNRRPVSHAAAGSYVIDPNANEIAAAQLAVDGEVEHRQIAIAALNLDEATSSQPSLAER
jgi:hypothetical protein